MAMTLDITQKQEVTYCIPLWLRDEQIRVNCRRPIPRIEPHPRREESVAVVCFGPSLQQTWEQVKPFKYVISCSGAHPFLIERGIVPNWHVAVDPLPGNTVKLIGQPHADVEYLISSTCHPDVFAHLEGYRATLWHVFDASADGQRLLPAGEWAITGGCDVGLRALTIAGFLGFRDLHVFGMDQSAGTVDAPCDSRHAGAHPASRKKYQHCEYKGVTYLTTSSMLEAARTVWHELDMMPSVKAQFYGEGLCQAMAKHYVPTVVESKRQFENMVAALKPATISADYASLNAQLHRENLAYGVGGGKHADTVRKLREVVKAESVLDYGAGKGYLAKALEFPIWQYDPAIPEISESPRPADLVVCTDVLEHVEPELLSFVLSDLRRCVKKIGYFVIHTGPAQKKLADGRNTHLIQRSGTWWGKKLGEYFDVGKVFELKHRQEAMIIVSPKTGKKKPAPVSVVKPAAEAPAEPMMVVTDIQVMP